MVVNQWKSAITSINCRSTVVFGNISQREDCFCFMTASLGNQIPEITPPSRPPAKHFAWIDSSHAHAEIQERKEKAFQVVYERLLKWIVYTYVHLSSRFINRSTFSRYIMHVWRVVTNYLLQVSEYVIMLIFFQKMAVFNDLVVTLYTIFKSNFSTLNQPPYFKSNISSANQAFIYYTKGFKFRIFFTQQ